jgi:hypothetical protein
VAGKTSFDVTMTMVSKVPVTYVESATLQKQENAVKGTKTLGVTNPSVAIPEPTLEWQETSDKATGMYTVVITKVSVAVSISATVMIDKAIDRTSDCYKHVFEHEKRHLQAYKDGAASHEAAIRRAVTDATAPQLKTPVKVAKKDLAKFKERAQRRVVDALDSAVVDAMKEIKTDSLAIHTAAELKKTDTICANYLKEP